MSSLPNATYLSVTPNSSGGERVHRHRRSAAISGDFDNFGLGLFSPSSKPNNKDDDTDAHFNFNNDDDFAKSVSDFSFPNSKNYDNFMVSTPPRYFNSNGRKNLHSPIKLNQKRAFNKKSSNSNLNSNHPNTPKTKFFLTEETNLNNDNVPDAVIDLDEVLNANLHIGDYIHRCQKEKDDVFFDDEYLSSPFLKPLSSSPYTFSPSISLPNTTLLQQPIQENINDDIENSHDDDAVIGIDENEVLYNPPNIAGEVYSNSSTNSSCSSLKRQSVEKIMSNSSRDSNTSPPIVNHNIVNSTPKRSGAKANRYQSFYDQSFKLSNALKSSESVNLTKPNSPKHVNMTLYMSSNNSSTLHTPPHQPQSQPQGLSQAFGQPKFYKESSRLLAHSSSLPVLQSQRGMPKYQRHGELRTRYIEINKLSPPPSIQSATSGSPTSSPSKGTLPKFIQKDNRIEISVTSPQQQTTSNSPISIISDTNSTMTSNISTVQSTDHSSFVSDSKEREKERALQTPPMIVVSNEKDSNDIETVRNSPVFMSSGSKPSSPTKRTPRRPLTPNEQKVIQETRIPPFKANMHQKSAKKPSEFKVPAPKRINDHSKSKSLSMVLTDLAPKLSKSTSTLGDDSSIKSNKSSKLISWFRRK